jgi:hypothetical protein
MNGMEHHKSEPKKCRYCGGVLGPSPSGFHLVCQTCHMITMIYKPTLPRGNKKKPTRQQMKRLTSLLLEPHIEA